MPTEFHSQSHILLSTESYLSVSHVPDKNHLPFQPLISLMFVHYLEEKDNLHNKINLKHVNYMEYAYIYTYTKCPVH